MISLSVDNPGRHINIPSRKESLDDPSHPGHSSNSSSVGGSYMTGGYGGNDNDGGVMDIEQEKERERRRRNNRNLKHHLIEQERERELEIETERKRNTHTDNSHHLDISNNSNNPNITEGGGGGGVGSENNPNSPNNPNNPSDSTSAYLSRKRYGHDRYSRQNKNSSSNKSNKPSKLSFKSSTRAASANNPNNHNNSNNPRRSSNKSNNSNNSNTYNPKISSVVVWLISARSIHLSVNTQLNHLGSLASIRAMNAGDSNIRNLQEQNCPLVIYLHGGGWLSRFKSTDFGVISRWSRELDVPFLYLDYSLTPDGAKYPQALEEALTVYCWVLEGRLGIRTSRVILAGDSSGGNLAVGVTLRCIEAEIRVPDSVFLAYPILDLRKTSSSVSRSLYMMDPILPMNLISLSRSLYIPSTQQSDLDPCLSPLVASPELLKSFPPCSIMVGEMDPFLDDAVSFVHALNRSGRPCRLKVYEKLPHSFLNFALLLPQAREAAVLAGQWMRTDLFTQAY